MPIAFLPRPGTVLICDFRTGFVPPEMVKRRPVVVLSPHRSELSGPHIVVPLSTTKPWHIQPVHVPLPIRRYNFLRGPEEIWAKCDMLTAVASSRLERLYSNGHRITPIVRDRDLTAIRRGVLHAIGLSRLTARI